MSPADATDRAVAGVRRGQFGLAELAIAGLGLATVAFIVLDEDTEATMFGLAFAGFVAGRLVGISRRALGLFALALGAFIGIVLIAGIGRSPATGTAGHLLVSVFLALALARPVWERLPPETVASWRGALVLVAVVLALGVVWEVAEQIADRLFGTAIGRGFDNTARDLAADMVGALVGALLAVRFVRPSLEQRPPTDSGA
jgi:hypothetical protein